MEGMSSMFDQPDVDAEQERPLVKAETPETKESPKRPGTGESAASQSGSPHGVATFAGVAALLEDASHNQGTEDSLDSALEVASSSAAADENEKCSLCGKRRRANKQKTCVVCKSDIQAARRHAESEGESTWFTKLVKSGGPDFQDRFGLQTYQCVP